MKNRYKEGVEMGPMNLWWKATRVKSIFFSTHYTNILFQRIYEVLLTHYNNSQSILTINELVKFPKSSKY